MANLTKHWKSYTNPDYIGAYTFLTESNGTIVSTPQIYTITDVRQKDVTGEGGKSSKEIVVSLSGEAKGMIMNAGNSKKMIELFGDICMIPDNWVGKTIKVGALKIMERKQMVWRMKIIEASTVSGNTVKIDKRPEMTPSHENWDKVKAAIDSKAYTITDIENKYQLTPKNKELLCLTSK